LVALTEVVVVDILVVGVDVDAGGVEVLV
jgi:hypothetical protein